MKNILKTVIILTLNNNIFNVGWLALGSINEKNSTRRKMDNQDQYLDIQLYDKHLIYSIKIFKYSAATSEIFILNNLSISDSEAEYSDIINFNI